MAGQPFRSALFNKDKQACYKSVSSILKANELVNLINDLLFSSAAVIYRGDAELHPICIINSIKNFIGDKRESPSKSLLHFAVDYITSFEFRKLMSTKAFNLTSYYDSIISNWLNNESNIKFPEIEP